MRANIRTEPSGLGKYEALEWAVFRNSLGFKLLLPTCLYFFRGSWLLILSILVMYHMTKGITHNILIDRINALRASHWNAKLVPRVRGRMILNIDIMLAWLKHRNEDVGRLFVDLQRIHGNTFNTRVFGEDQVLSLDPVVFDYVMNTGFEEFEKGPKFRSRVGGLLGDGIFNSDGENWRMHRNVTRRFFNQDRISPTIMSPFITRTLSTLPSGPFDIQAVLGELALELAINWLTGDDLQAPTDRGPHWLEAKRDLRWAMTEGQRVMGRRLMVGSIWPIFEPFKNGLKAPAEVLRRFFEPLIEEAQERQKWREANEKLETGGHLIDRLLSTITGRRGTSDQLINVLLAARDTTASLLTFLTYASIHEADAFAMVEEEILREIGEDGEITSASLSRLKHCRPFIDETLRLFPPVPLNIRRAINPTVLPGNHYMPGGASIVLSTINMHRSPEWWGQDADEFNPSRWTERKEIPLAYRPFNAGPRTCAGQKMALNAAETYIVLLVQHMAVHKVCLRLASGAQPESTRVPLGWKTRGDGRARGGREDVWPISDITLTVKGGLWVEMVDASSQS